ncbi:MAG: sigma-70 family RNA polymerase sigma factor [Deltaproteobacteria bacterium]|nr:sigma-70 family RNA polymerase sigma factor [Deltaproteobacteria bacterium]
MSILGHLWPRPTAERVVRDYSEWVYRRLKRIFGPNADIDDAYQTVFVEVIRALPSFAGRSQLSTWIRRITYNVAYQEMRLRYRQPECTEIDESNIGQTDVTYLIEAREASRCLYAALSDLEPTQRLAVVLHDLEGLTLKDISTQTGRPLPTIASQLASGRARLARCFAARVFANKLEDSVKVGSPHSERSTKEAKP